MNAPTSNTPRLYNPKANAPAVYIPAWLSQIPNSELKYQCKLVYGRLAQWSTNEGRAHRSAKQLSLELGMPERTVEKCLKSLREAKLIGCFQPRDGGHNHFEFYDHDWMYRPLVDELCYSKSPSAQQTVPTAHCAVHTAQQTVHKIKEIKEIKTTTTVSGSFIEKVLKLKPPIDTRTDQEYLEHIQDHIKQNKKNMNLHKRHAGIITILTNLLANNEIFISEGYVSNETKEETKRKQDDLYHARLAAQEKQHQERLRKQHNYNNRDDHVSS